MEKPAPPRHICVVGDSILRAVVYDQAEGRYTHLKESPIAAFARAHDMAITNCTAFGCTAQKGLEKLRRALERHPDIDTVLIEFGGNDCDRNWDKVAADPMGENPINTPYPAFLQQLREMAQMAINAGKQTFLMNLPPIDASRYFRWVSQGDEQRARNILTFLKDKSLIYRYHEYYSRGIEQVARELNVPVVNVRDAFLALYDLPRYLCIDGIHPNHKGQDIIQALFEESYQSIFQV